MIGDIRLREAIGDDRPGVIALIERVYREYGEQLCLENADADLLSVPDCYVSSGGEMVVLDLASPSANFSRETPPTGEIVGCHALAPLLGRADVCTFRRLYLHPELRGTGWGTELMRWAVDRALAHGFQQVEFWSDTRFQRAHRFFARCGFRKTGEVREMNDGVAPYREYSFQGDLGKLASSLAK